jgi:predicted dehydrogenase
MNPIRVSLIGYGYVGKTFHAPLILSVEGLALTVVGSSRPDAVHADLPHVRVCSFEEAATAEDADLVVIATPNTSHYPLAVAALEAGKHVVIDKPFTTTLADARALVVLAAKHNRLLSVFHNRRWDSEVLATKAILASGALGRVSLYECHMDRFRPNVRQRWRENPGEGAGLWFDLGPHLIDQCLFLFGLPDTVTSSIAILREGGQTDDWAHTVLTYPGLRIVLNATLLAAGRGPRTIVHGTLATWMKYGADTQEPQLQSGMLPTDPRFGIDPDPGILIDGATGTRTEIPAPHQPQQGYYAGIRDAIANNNTPPLSGREAVAVMAILETTFESARQGRTLPIPLTMEERAAWNI